MRVNRYKGICGFCHNTVLANAGTLVRLSGGWKPAHLDCAAGEEPAVISVYSPVTGFYGTRNAKGLCEDAPCCGCCTF